MGDQWKRCTAVVMVAFAGRLRDESDRAAHHEFARRPKFTSATITRRARTGNVRTRR